MRFRARVHHKPLHARRRLPPVLRRLSPQSRCATAASFSTTRQPAATLSTHSVATVSRPPVARTLFPRAVSTLNRSGARCSLRAVAGHNVLVRAAAARRWVGPRRGFSECPHPFARSERSRCPTSVSHMHPSLTPTGSASSWGSQSQCCSWEASSPGSWRSSRRRVGSLQPTRRGLSGLRPCSS